MKKGSYFCGSTIYIYRIGFVLNHVKPAPKLKKCMVEETPDYNNGGSEEKKHKTTVYPVDHSNWDDLFFSGDPIGFLWCLASPTLRDRVARVWPDFWPRDVQNWHLIKNPNQCEQCPNPSVGSTKMVARIHRPS